MTEKLLLQLLFLLVPMMLYQIFVHRYDKTSYQTRKYVTGIVGGLSGILCMLYSVSMGGGFIWDMRCIGFILPTLYLGVESGCIALGMILLTRTLLPSSQSLIILAWTSGLLMGVVALIVHPLFKRSSMNIRFVLGVLMSIFASSVVALCVLVYNKFVHIQIPILFFLGSALLQAMSVLILLYLAEWFNETLSIRSRVMKHEQMKLVSDLAASVVHEIRNPLTVVSGFIQLLRENASDREKRYIMLILEELSRTEDILNEYLALSKTDMKSEPILVSERLKQAASVMQAYANMKSVGIRTECEENLWILGDKNKLSQIIMNLIKNSVEAIEASGEIRITCSRKDSFVCLKIQDDGEGMTKDQVKRLGNPYYSTKEKGSGLGLAVTFRLIEWMNGTIISIKSEKDVGTTFHIHFPLLPTRKGV